MSAPPHEHLEGAIRSAKAAHARTDVRDRGTLKHAISLLERVHGRNTDGGGYADAITRAVIKKPKRKD